MNPCFVGAKDPLSSIDKISMTRGQSHALYQTVVIYGAKHASNQLLWNHRSTLAMDPQSWIIL